MPIIILYFLFTILQIISSSLFPPIFTILLITIPPSDVTVISVVSAPMFTIMFPLALSISIPRPTASAIGFSTIFISFALILESLITS